MSRELMEYNQDFKDLTPSEKVYFWFLISEFNLRGQFYKADLEIAETLRLSESKVRKARRMFQRLGWITIQPGFRSRGKNIATTYEDVKWSKPIKGDWFAQVHRYTFEVLLDKLRVQVCSHEDVVVYVYLSYLYWKNRGKNGSKFFVTKSDLSELTGIRTAATRVSRLQALLTASDRDALFTFEDRYHKIVFTEWYTYVDPSENERNREESKRLQSKRMDEISKARRLKEAATQDLTPDEVWRLYQECFGHQFTGKKRIRELVEEHGANTIVGRMGQFRKVRGYGRDVFDFDRWLNLRLKASNE
ncbi:MAG: hypothetical protein RDV00_04680 [Clostridia bacterium]|nr:hypothetical protein [Clostridia bacterium]